MEITEVEECKGVVISCFDFSGIFVKPWADAGFECHIIDTQHKEGEHTDGIITKWGMDVRHWKYIFLAKYPEKVGQIVFAAFFPPCTDLAVSGARWFAQKEEDHPGTRQRAMDLIYWSNLLGNQLACPFFIENPVSVISTEWKKPDYYFHPYEFGGYPGGEKDDYTKKTCLWTGGDFKFPEKRKIKLNARTAERIWRMPPSAERQNERSITPLGFSVAVFEANVPR